MKSSITFFFLFLISFSFSQENFDYQKYSNPDPENELSIYFKKHIPEQLLTNITYSKNKSNLIVSFYINKEGIPYNVNINSSRNSKLNKILRKKVESYPFNKMDIKLDTSKKYSFQIISKNENINRINCSSKLIIESAPICNNCNDLNFYQDIVRCVEDKIKNHFINSIDFSISSNFKNQEKLNIHLELSLDNNGTLNLDKIKKADEIFYSEINSSVKSFPKLIASSSINNTFKKFKHNIYLNFNKGKKPKFDKPIFNNFDSIFKPNSENNLASYFSKNLNATELQNANLNRVNKKLSIFFEINKKNKLHNIRTNSRSNILEQKIISLFKNFNIEELNLVDKHHFNSYFTPIIVFENEKNIIKTNSIIGYNRIPIFPKCRKSKDLVNAKKCFNTNIQKHFSKNFNSRLPNNLGLSPGRKRVFISFTINKKGFVSKVNVRAPHPKLKKEIIRVIKKLPRVKPAIFGRKLANIKYSIPFTLIVE
ncbi:hypothetical protein OD91_0455 [Lutibacter sp. Hel_I_33_5]|uniref:energy transducer TonB n=1 Tax=Lutibacter sp. Hel_I_33_5 TaxID=1566289 RepID=UPI0011A36300|nr:hypothetical protein [Lutibacter sp. Hel_I_33_5]TVZ55210.1 hypothetical protein OD91_0455 [Lutibacter sp. Hel_I_33_5]